MRCTSIETADWQCRECTYRLKEEARKENIENERGGGRGGAAEWCRAQGEHANNSPATISVIYGLGRCL